MSRDEVIQAVIDGGLTSKDAAAQLHLTPTRIMQLVKVKLSGAPLPGDKPGRPSIEVKPVLEKTEGPYAPKKAPMPDALTGIPGQTNAPAATPKVSSLQAALDAAKGVRAPGTGEAKPPGKIRVTATRITPEEADAYSEFGKEILMTGREMCVDNIAEYAFDLDPEDPQLQPIRKGSKLWNLALKHDKQLTGTVGRVASNPWFLLGFAIFECLNVARACRRIDKNKNPSKYKAQRQEIEARAAAAAEAERLKKEAQINAGGPAALPPPEPEPEVEAEAPKPNGSKPWSLKDELSS